MAKEKVKITPETIYFQPILTDAEWNETDLPSFGVFLKLENAKSKFPGKVIAAYSGDDIEEPTFMDLIPSVEGNAGYAVDIPQLGSDEYLNAGIFKTKPEALEFAIEQFGADENGFINLVTSL